MTALIYYNSIKLASGKGVGRPTKVLAFGPNYFRMHNCVVISSRKAN